MGAQRVWAVAKAALTRVFGVRGGRGAAHDLLDHGRVGRGLTRVVGPGLHDAAGPSGPLADQGVEVGYEAGGELELGLAPRERSLSPQILAADRQALRAARPRPLAGGGKRRQGVGP